MASPNSTLPRTPEEQDSRYNPAEQAYQEKMGAGYVSSGTDQLESFANDPNNASKEAQEAEDADYSGQNGLYRPTSGGKKQQTFTIKGLLKKKGPLGAIIGILVGGGGAFSLMFTPGLGIVQLKETLVGDLNDQLAAVDLRSNSLWRSKLGTIQGTGLCSNNVKIRCQFTTMSKRQIERFKKAGFTINETVDGAFGRQRITNMTAPDGVSTISNPQDLTNLRNSSDPNIRNQTRTAMNKVFNPILGSLSDTTALKVLQEKLKTSKSAKLVGATPEELDASFVDSTDGNALQGGDGRISEDADGRKYVQGPDGIIYEDQPGYNEIIEKARVADADLRAKSTPGAGKAVSGVLGGAVKGVSVLGAADASCTVYNTARAVAAAAKAARAIQLSQYAMVFLNTADQIKAGEATPEQVAYVGNMLTSVDTRKQVVDEKSATTGATVDEQAGNGQLRDNEFYGKNAFDSPGYSIAAYNDAPTLTSRSQQYMVGGGLTGSLSSVTDDITKSIGGSPREVCGVIQSWWVRGAGLAVGVIAAIGSFGVGTIVSISASMAVSFALPFLEAMLADIIAGNAVGKDTVGVDAGDAAFSGTSAILGSVAQARGMKPLTSGELEGYLTQTSTVKNEYIAHEKFEAQATPFDVNNQYSFLGSFARSINIPVAKAATGFNGLLSSVPTLFSTSLATIIPSASAATAYNPERFNKCDDDAYTELGIAADVFCNVRYGLSPTELSLDPLNVVDYMLEKEYIDPSGNAKGDYEQFKKYCSDREDGWGETGQEGADTWMTGARCMEDSEMMSNFRVFTMDSSISNAMDYEEVKNSTGGNVEGLVAPLVDGFRLSDGFGPRSCPGCSSWHQGQDLVNGDRTVRSVMSGTVLSVDSGGNNTVRIQHSDGLISVYLHMYREDITVNTGDTVTAGQQIGLIGNAGQSQGAHLHFEFDISEVQDRALYEQKYVVNTGGFNPGMRIDPADYFRKNGIAGF